MRLIQFLESNSGSVAVWWNPETQEALSYPWEDMVHHNNMIEKHPEFFGLDNDNSQGDSYSSILTQLLKRGFVRGNYRSNSKQLWMQLSNIDNVAPFIVWSRKNIGKINEIDVEIGFHEFGFGPDQIDRILMTGKLPLKEAKQVGILYHYTTLPAAFKILRDNRLVGKGSFVSFTRSQNYHKTMFATPKPPYVRLAFDGDKISNSYKIEPIAGSLAKIRGSYRPETDESEEIIRAHSIPINSFLVGIDINEDLIEHNVLSFVRWGALEREYVAEKTPDHIKELLKEHKLLLGLIKPELTQMDSHRAYLNYMKELSALEFTTPFVNNPRVHNHSIQIGTIEDFPAGMAIESNPIFMNEGKFHWSEVYRLHMPDGGEDGVLIGWRADWPKNSWVEFRGPDYTQWTGSQKSDFEKVHDSMKGWHTSVLHAGETVDILPTHPDYERIKNAIEKAASEVSESMDGFFESIVKELTGYHSTPHDVDEFRPLTHFGSPETAEDLYLQDLLVNKSSVASSPYRTYRANIDMKNPALMFDRRMPHRAMDIVDGMLALYDNAEAIAMYDGAKPGNFSGDELQAFLDEWNEREMYIDFDDEVERGKQEDQRKKDLIWFLKSRGHDGIKYINRQEGKGTWSYISLSPIKAESRNRS